VLPGATGPDAGALVFVNVRFGFVVIDTDVWLLLRVPLVPASLTDAVLLSAVTPAGAPLDATVI
jgi:hypothetical protein